jgi:hypothetical protein
MWRGKEKASTPTIMASDDNKDLLDDDEWIHMATTAVCSSGRSPQ